MSSLNQLWILIWTGFLFLSIQMKANKAIDDFLQQQELVLNQHVSLDKFMIQFKTNTTHDAKTAFFLKYTFLMPYQTGFETGRENWVLARLINETTDYKALKKMMENLQADVVVNLINPVLERENEHPILILNPVFISLKNEADLSELSSILVEHHIEAVEMHQRVNQVFQFQNHKNSGYNNLEWSIYLNQLNFIAFAEPNYGFFLKATTTNDPILIRQWNIENTGSSVQGNGTPGADMQVLKAWDITKGSPFIKVAILDSGVDTLHVDLKEKLMPGFDATGGGSMGYPNMRFNSDAHGTACAGIVGAEADNGVGVAGVAYETRLVPIKVFFYVDSIIPGQIVPFSESQWMADGIAWAWQNANADIMSNSWAVQDILLPSLPGSPAIVDSAIAQAYHLGRNGKGTSMFFSSGNDGFRPYWPARLAQTFAVNATSMCDERKDSSSCDNENWWAGNWRSTLDFGAPGVRIPTTDITGNFGFSNNNYTFTFNGTSAACPNAAAVGALVLSLNEDITVENLRFILGSTADKVGGYDYSAVKSAGPWSEELGFGRINAFEAVKAAQNFIVGIEDKKVDASFHVYPNPGNENDFVIENFNLEARILHIEVLHVNGQQIGIYEPLSISQNQIKIEINENLPQGIYLLKIMTGNGFVVHRWMKK